MEQRDKIFDLIVQANRGGIYRICLAYLYDQSQADDLYQEILLQVWKSLDSFKGAAQISTWVYRVAVNTAISYNASHKKSRHEPLPDVLNIADDHTAAAQQKENKLNRLHQAINQLEEQDRLLISLVLEDMSYKEIAEITGSNTNNIGVRISRIKARLLKIMNDKMPEDGL